jgi:hypothetical protein
MKLSIVMYVIDCNVAMITKGISVSELHRREGWRRDAFISFDRRVKV